MMGSASLVSIAPQPPVTRFDRADRRALVESLLAAFLRRDPMPRDFHELARAHPVPAQILVLLEEATSQCSIDETRVVAAFLAWLEGHADTADLDPDFCAMLRGQVAGQRGLRALRKFMTERLGK